MPPYRRNNHPAAIWLERKELVIALEIVVLLGFLVFLLVSYPKVSTIREYYTHTASPENVQNVNVNLSTIEPVLEEQGYETEVSYYFVFDSDNEHYRIHIDIGLEDHVLLYIEAETQNGNFTDLDLKSEIFDFVTSALPFDPRVEHDLDTLRDFLRKERAEICKAINLTGLYEEDYYDDDLFENLDSLVISMCFCFFQFLVILLGIVGYERRRKKQRYFFFQTQQSAMFQQPPPGFYQGVPPEQHQHQEPDPRRKPPKT